MEFPINKVSNQGDEFCKVQIDLGPERGGGKPRKKKEQFFFTSRSGVLGCLY